MYLLKPKEISWRVSHRGRKKKSVCVQHYPIRLPSGITRIYWNYLQEIFFKWERVVTLAINHPHNWQCARRYGHRVVFLLSEYFITFVVSIICTVELLKSYVKWILQSDCVERSLNLKCVPISLGNYMDALQCMYSCYKNVLCACLFVFPLVQVVEVMNKLNRFMYVICH